MPFVENDLLELDFCEDATPFYLHALIVVWQAPQFRERLKGVFIAADQSEPAGRKGEEMDTETQEGRAHHL